MTIVVRTTGGLGNQFFQYAMGRYLAIKCNAELLLDDSFYVKIPSGVTPRDFELDRYSIQARKTSESERQLLKIYTGQIWKRARHFLPLPGPFHYVREPVTGKFLTSARELGDDVFLDGCWQSERYFAGIDDLLRQEFVPRTPASADDDMISTQMRSCTSVSLHVRRGDYITNRAANALLGVCDLSYYDAAIQYIGQQFHNPVFFVFSDDMDWAKDNLHIPFASIFVDHNSTNMAFQDLRLMSSCKHHIIANSSFSWWGAWLNPSKEKIVVRPRKWYIGLPTQGDWTCPPQWIAL